MNTGPDPYYNLKDSDVFHQDEVRKRQDDFSVDDRNLVDALRGRGNPFIEAGVDLVNRDGRISNSKYVSAICNMGKDQYDQFVNDVIVTRGTPLGDCHQEYSPGLAN